MIDPRDADLVLKTVEREGLNVTKLVSTNHLDQGGNKKFLEKFPNLQVVGFDERIPGLTQQLSHNELVPVGQQKIRALFTPCNTAGSGVFHVLSARKLGFSKSPNRNPHSILFSGDTLLVGGCGKFDEGTEREMYNNLIHIIGALPSDTEVYCGHEYTVQNLEFAHALLHEQDFDVQRALERARVTRSAFVPTVPAILEDEFLSNPFMRVNHTHVARAIGCGLDKTPQEVFRRLREKKNLYDTSKGLAYQLAG